jgi:hypothetical protein
MRINGVTALLAYGVALHLQACVVVTEDSDPPVGTLTVEWSINGQRNPSDCVDFEVDRLELWLYTALDQLVDQVEPICESFSVSVDLFEGRYEADATLVDSFARAATVTQTINAIDIIEGTDLVVGIDFPIETFL